MYHAYVRNVKGYSQLDTETDRKYKELNPVQIGTVPETSKQKT